MFTQLEGGEGDEPVSIAHCCTSSIRVSPALSNQQIREGRQVGGRGTYVVFLTPIPDPTTSRRESAFFVSVPVLRERSRGGPEFTVAVWLTRVESKGGEGGELGKVEVRRG